jgi:hypothetical protein
MKSVLHCTCLNVNRVDAVRHYDTSMRLVLLLIGCGVAVGVSVGLRSVAGCVGVSVTSSTRVGAVVGVIADEVSALSRSITAKALVSPTKER